MNNPQGEVKTYKHGACRVCGHGLNAAGECFLFPFHSQEPAQAEIAPGMVTEWAEVLTCSVMPAFSYQSIVAAAGARPEPFRA